MVKRCPGWGLEKIKRISGSCVTRGARGASPHWRHASVVHVLFVFVLHFKRLTKMIYLFCVVFIHAMTSPKDQEPSSGASYQDLVPAVWMTALEGQAANGAGELSRRLKIDKRHNTDHLGDSWRMTSFVCDLNFIWCIYIILSTVTIWSRCGH